MRDRSGKDRETVGVGRQRPCPICSKLSVKASYPFCSERCREIDLHRWLGGVYAIPAEEEDFPSAEDSGEE